MKTGTYISGRQYVVSPVRVASYTPAPAVADAPDVTGITLTNVVKNGAMLDMGKDVMFEQGFTDRAVTSLNRPYSAAKNIGLSLPVDFAAGEEGSFTISTFKEDADAKGNPMISQRQTFTVVATEPAAGSFAPAPAATSKASTFVETDLIDLATLPSLSMPGKPNWLTLVNSLRMDQAVEYGVGNYYWLVMPEGNTRGGVWKIYGLARNISQAVLLLCSDIPVAQKRDLAVVICQLGIDLDERLQKIIANGESDWGGISGAGGLGGVNTGHEKLALLAAGVLLNDTGMKTRGALPRFGEDGNTKIVTQTMIDDGVTAPGNTTGGFKNYIQDDLGAPEWTQSNGKITNSGNRLISDGYRIAHLSARVTAALAVQLWPGLYAAYPSDPRDNFVNYADRVMERWFYKTPSDPGLTLPATGTEIAGDAGLDYSNKEKWARLVGGNNGLPQWVIDAWDAHRVSAGQTAVWNWPA